MAGDFGFYLDLPIVVVWDAKSRLTLVRDVSLEKSDRKMKSGKAIPIVFIVLTGLLVLWFNLPIQIQYYSEIKSGDQFVKNIIKYKEQTGQLPKENDWEILAKLNPIKPFENFYPEYRIVDENNFHLTFVEGFDPPYLQYDTRTKIWEKK